MRSTPSLLAAVVLATGMASATAAPGVFYDPSNVDSPTGFTTGYELFRTIGCPGRQLLDKPCEVLDSDGDGVYDYMDKCPDTPPGTRVDKVGCPLPERAGPAAAPVPAPAALAPAVAPQMPDLQRVNFDFDRATIRPEDREKLDQDAATLKEWGDVKVEIAGYTDSVGSAQYNRGLSVRRAEAVRRYLIEKGIAADRLTLKGYGEAMPLADNATAAGRAMNRRVELVPLR